MMCGSRRSVNHRKIGSCSGITTGQSNLTTSIKTGLVYCFSCDTAFRSQSKMPRYCSNCGQTLLLCPISKNLFHTGDKFAQCDQCNSVFHYSHLRDWLKKNTQCPVCRTNLNEILSGKVGINTIIQ